MTDSVNEIRETVLPVLKRHGVVRAALFGSVARGEARSDSDLDLLVEFEDGRSLLDQAGLRMDLQELLGRVADVVTYASLHPRLRERILREQVLIYGT
jgi:hypothetical protein